MKRPSFQFYPADWRNDAALRMCSLSARGLWWEMICIMHAAAPYGHLVAAGEPINPGELARIVGESKADVTKWLAELERRKVYSTTAEGAIYSRRMIRDEEDRAKWRERQSRHRDVTPSVTRDVTPKSRRSSSSSSSSKKKDTPGAFAPPDWVPLEAWTAWLEVRRKKRAPNTDEALRLSVLDLQRFKDAGHDPRAVLEQSVKRGWQGLFELKADTQQASAAPPANAIAEACPCGASGAVKVGGRWRCNAHVREEFQPAARAA